MTGPIALDVETTGLDPDDRVTEIAIVDFHSGQTLLSTYVNPERPIPAEVTEKTRITDDMVRDAPKFPEIAGRVRELIHLSSHVVGYNPRFDQGMIDSEFERMQANPPRWPWLIDAKRVWDINEPTKRKLVHAYERFVDANGYEGAHGALPDTMAVRAVLLGQIDQFGLHEKALETLDPDTALQWGPSHHLRWKEDRSAIIVNFGKYKGRSVADVPNDFWGWLMRKDFPEHVKMMARCCTNIDQRDRDARILTWAREFKAEMMTRPF